MFENCPWGHCFPTLLGHAYMQAEQTTSILEKILEQKAERGVASGGMKAEMGFCTELNTIVLAKVKGRPRGYM